MRTHSHSQTLHKSNRWKNFPQRVFYVYRLLLSLFFFIFNSIPENFSISFYCIFHQAICTTIKKQKTITEQKTRYTNKSIVIADILRLYYTIIMYIIYLFDCAIEFQQFYHLFFFFCSLRIITCFVAFANATVIL